jgi:ribokinase
VHLDEARRVLERAQARRRTHTPGAAKAPDGRDGPGRPDYTAEREGSKPAAPPALLVHATILRMRLVSLGDLILDVVVGLEGPLVPGDDRAATTRVGAGGQGANVAAWAATLGAEARYVGKRGADHAGELAARELAAYGVELAGPAAGRGGVVVSIATGGERSMASDRGSATELEPAELDPGWFDVDVLHVSGYALLCDPAASAAERAVELARGAGARISLDLSAWSLVDEPFRERARRVAPEVVFATERERDAFGTLESSWVVKRGAYGVRVDGVDHPALPAEIVDPTGAGDAFAAGFLVGGVGLGLEAAARCCAKLGAMP